jgi:hypothetical protein
MCFERLTWRRRSHVKNVLIELRELTGESIERQRDIRSPALAFPAVLADRARSLHADQTRRARRRACRLGSPKMDWIRNRVLRLRETSAEFWRRIE